MKFSLHSSLPTTPETSDEELKEEGERKMGSTLLLKDKLVSFIKRFAFSIFYLMLPATLLCTYLYLLSLTHHSTTTTAAAATTYHPSFSSLHPSLPPSSSSFSSGMGMNFILLKLQNCLWFCFVYLILSFIPYLNCTNIMVFYCHSILLL